MNVDQFLRLLSKRRWLVIYSGCLVAVLAFIAAYFLASYRVTSRIVVHPVSDPKSAATSPQVGVLPGSSTNLQTFSDTYLQILQSRPVAERVLQRLKQERGEPKSRSVKDYFRGAMRLVFRTGGMLLNLRTPVKLSQEDREIREIQEALQGTFIAKTSVFEITAKERKPDAARKLSRLAAESFVEYSQQQNAQQASVINVYLKEQITQTQQDLERAQDAVRRFREENKIIISFDKQEIELAARMADIDKQEQTATLDLEDTESRIAEERAAAKASPKTIQSASTVDADPLVQSLRSRLVTLEIELPRLLMDFDPQHPKIIAHNLEVSAVRKRLETEVERTLTTEVTTPNPIRAGLESSLATDEVARQGLLARLAALKRSRSQVKEKYSGLLETKFQSDRLEDRAASLKTQLDHLTTELRSGELLAAAKVSEIEVLEFGLPPEYPTVKKLPLMFFPGFGFILGTLAGAGVLIGLYYLDPMVKDPDAIQEDLKLPVYAVIPHDALSRGSTVATDALAHSYRALDLRLSASMNGRHLQSLVVSSVSSESEGAKISRLLAEGSARAGLRTALIDYRGGATMPTRESGVAPAMLLEVLDPKGGKVPAWNDPQRTEKLATFLRAHGDAYDRVVVLAPSLDTDVSVVRLALLPETSALLVVVQEGTTPLAAARDATAPVHEFGLKNVGLVYVQ